MRMSTPPPAPLATRPRITVGLTLQAKQDGNAATAVSGNIDLTLYGPADVIGIDQRLIVRTDPRPNTTNFEPNYLAIVDFDPPDFPWLLTPARANATGHLRPWLVLVVVERKKVAPPTLRAGRPLPSISLTATQVQSELPDLAESWLWAHSQAVSTVNVVTPPTPENQAAAAQTLSTEMRQAPERNISRLVCPRRLTPRTDYVACVVPATEGGRLRGLGQPVAGDTLGLAWSKQAANDIELPVYFSWTFSTGPVGDIETLARRLRTPSQYGGDAALLAQLRHIGERPVYVDGDHLLFDGPTPGQTVFEGAMVSLGFTPEASNAVYAGKLAGDPEQRLLARGRRHRPGGARSDPRAADLRRVPGEAAHRHHHEDQPALARWPVAAAALSAGGGLGRRSGQAEPGRVHAGGVGAAGRRARGRARILAGAPCARRPEAHRSEASRQAVARPRAGGDVPGARAHRDRRQHVAVRAHGGRDAAAGTLRRRDAPLRDTAPRRR